MILTALCLAPLVGCASSSGRGTGYAVKHDAINELEKDPVPGTVTDVWAEPMYDTVRVPGQIDRKGVYYRASSNQLVRIRPGRFQQVQYPETEPPPPDPVPVK